MNALRNAGLCATAVFTLTACAPKAPDTAADVAALRAAGAAFFQLYNAGDADGVAALYAEDGVILAANTPVLVGRAAIRDFIASKSAQYKAAGLASNSDSVTDVGVVGDMAWITGTFHVTNASGAKVYTGKYMALYRRDNGKWPIVRDTWNADTPPAAAPAN